MSDAPFSNGFEWDCWSSKWCQRCAKDANDDCALILTAMCGTRPVEWLEMQPNGLEDRYDCSEFVLATAPLALPEDEESGG